jgi:sialidase-1
VIYSDDHSKNWKISESITPGCNESTIAELSDGTLMMNMRSYNRQKSRAISISRDGGTTWSPIKHDQALIEPVCQASLVSYRCRDNDNKNLLIFSNPANTSGRSKLTIRLSNDNGKTWPLTKKLHAGSAAYSSLAILPNGDIACFYESGIKSAYETIIYEVFSMESLRNHSTKIAQRQPTEFILSS